MPNVRNNRLLRKGRWPNQSQAQKLCRTHMPPGKLERDGNAGLITLLVSNLLASLCRSLSSCPASRLDSAKRHCLNLQAWPAFLHCMPTANLLMSSWSWLSFCPASKTSISEPTRNYSSKPWLYTCISALPTATLLVSSWSWLSFCTAPVHAGVQRPCRRAKTPRQWRTDWARGP